MFDQQSVPQSPLLSDADTASMSLANSPMRKKPSLFKSATIASGSILSSGSKKLGKPPQSMAELAKFFSRLLRMKVVADSQMGFA
jgi:hypothetical protein